MKGYIVRNSQTKQPFNNKIYPKLANAKNCINCHQLSDFEICEFEMVEIKGVVHKPYKSNPKPYWSKYDWCIELS